MKKKKVDFFNVHPFCYVYIMKLDYQLINIINNYKDGGCSKYDYVRSEIWFSKQELCDEVGKFLNIDIPIETNVTVTKNQMDDVYKLLDGRKGLIGMYGDDFLNDWRYGK